MADAPDLGSGAARRGGSSPPSRTTAVDCSRTSVGAADLIGAAENLGRTAPMAQYIDVEQTIGMHELHVVLTPSVPGPWTEAAKGILHVKKLSYGRYVGPLRGPDRR